jgi:hypothetical protein
MSLTTLNLRNCMNLAALPGSIIGQRRSASGQAIDKQARDRQAGERSASGHAIGNRASDRQAGKRSASG